MFCKTCKGTDCQNSANNASENIELDLEYDDDISMLIEPEIFLNEDECMDENFILETQNYGASEPDISMESQNISTQSDNDDSVHNKVPHKKIKNVG